MKIKTLTVVVEWKTRGDQHGYTPSDYARDAAAEINKRLGDQGLSSWVEGDAAAEQTAISAAESELAGVTTIGNELLKIDIETSEIEED